MVIQACLLGPTLAPFAGGVAAHYFTWRHMQYALAVAGTVAFIFMIFLLPETIPPGARGIDKANEGQEECEEKRPFKFVWLNPLSCLYLLRSPNLLALVCFTF